MLEKIKSKLIDDYHKCYNLWSVRFFVLIGIAPDLYNMMSSMGMFEQAPQGFIWVIRSLAMLGLTSRLIKQKGDKDGNTNSN